MKLLSTIITVLIFTLSFGVKSHSQINFLGLQHQENGLYGHIENLKTLGLIPEDTDRTIYCVSDCQKKNENNFCLKKNEEQYLLNSTQCYSRGRWTRSGAFSSSRYIFDEKKVLGEVQISIQYDGEYFSTYFDHDRKSTPVIITIPKKEFNGRWDIEGSNFRIWGDNGIEISCGYYNGCNYPQFEVEKYVLRETRKSLKGNFFNRPKFQAYDSYDRCLEGKAGDWICVEPSGDLWISSGSFGEAPMGLN